MANIFNDNKRIKQDLIDLYCLIEEFGLPQELASEKSFEYFEINYREGKIFIYFDALLFKNENQRFSCALKTQ